MALAHTITLESTGLDVEIPAYITLQNIHITQKRDLKTGTTHWDMTAEVMIFASREAKYAGKIPIEIGFINGVVDLSQDTPHVAAYAALKNTPRFAGAVDA